MRRPLALPLIALVSLAACSSTPAASSPAPTPSAVASHSAAPNPAPSATASPTPALPSPTAVASARPSATPSSVPEVGEAPAGIWTSVHWQKIAGLGLTGNDVHVMTWSRGYLVLDQSPGTDDEGDDLPVTIRVSASNDGVHWGAPTTLETGFRGNFAIREIVEGPSGLLALAFPYGDTCGGPEAVSQMWRSTDGRSWQRLALPKAFAANGVQSISGGDAGYIAFGGTAGDMNTPKIWTSPDATAWTGRPLPTVTGGTLLIDRVSAFGSGFVVLGGILSEGCGGGSSIKPAIWFSTTGASWTRASLPGASTAADAHLSMHSFADRLLVDQRVGDASTGSAWTSVDGQTFTSIGQPNVDVIEGASGVAGHALFLVEPESGIGPLDIVAVDSMGTATPVTQEGNVPSFTVDGPQPEFATGPTGLLAYTGDGRDSWIGIPK